MEKEPRRRLRDIGEARILLEDALSGSPADEEPRTRQAAKRPWGWIAASAASLLILVAVLVFDRPVPSTERVLRYSIPLPHEELTFSHALSPDGRYVAVQSVVNRNTQIFVRALDSWDLQPLPGTEGVNNLFWSPDSRYIAFFADEKLKQVAVNGGPSEELCDVPGLLGARGAWGRNDVIVFAPSNKYKPGPLRTVAATGGESSPLTTVEPGENHRFPVFLPDGRHFLYTSVGGSSPGIYLASLDDVDGRRLLADASSVHFAPAPVVGSLAHLLFIRDENVMAQPFDTGRLELTGDPFLLLEDVPYADDGAVEISVSDNRILSYRSGSNRETDSRFTWFDRSGNAISHEGPVGPAAAAALSPDEEAIAVTRRPPGSWTSDLYLRDLTRGIENRLTFHNAVDVATNAVWSPESRRIAFSANPGGTFDLYWKETRSSDPAVLLLETENPKYVSDWSRDGRYVLYTELDPETGADLWYLPLEREGAESEVLASEPVVFLQTEFLESAGQLSPDGRWIAYLSTESGERDVYVRPFPTGAGKWKISNGASVQPRWSPDGSELFYLTGPSSRQTVMSAAVTTPGSPASGGPPIFDTDAPEPLFDVQANAFHPATGTFFYSVSVDGQRFLVNHVGTTEDPVLNVVTNWQLAFVVPPAR